MKKEICCREIETAVLGNYRIEAAVTGEMMATEDFYDYVAKIRRRRKTEDQRSRRTFLRRFFGKNWLNLEVRGFWALDGAGFARCDFFMERQTDG